jgi:hypothetical protein
VEPGDEVTVLACIGCGAIATSQPCLGTCVDQRLELVSGEAHSDALARLADAREWLAEARVLARDLADAPSGGGEPEYRHLQLEARRLVAVPRPLDAERVTAWECASCGRIEAPQPCIGVCIRPPVRMVRGPAHDTVLDALAAVLHEAESLLAPLRRLAWSTPRPGQWERSLAALRDDARRLNP